MTKTSVCLNYIQWYQHLARLNKRGSLGPIKNSMLLSVFCDYQGSHCSLVSSRQTQQTTWTVWVFFSASVVIIRDTCWPEIYQVGLEKQGSDNMTMRQFISHDGSMGRTVYLPTWMVDFYGFHVGKYTSPMDPMGKGSDRETINVSFCLEGASCRKSTPLMGISPLPVKQTVEFWKLSRSFCFVQNHGKKKHRKNDPDIKEIYLEGPLLRFFVNVPLSHSLRSNGVGRESGIHEKPLDGEKMSASQGLLMSGDCCK